MPSFDVVSEVDKHELTNAVDQANRELDTRFDFKVAEGNAEYLQGKLQERYGWDRDRAQTEVRAFEKSLRDDT